jgi:hypothetical protein
VAGESGKPLEAKLLRLEKTRNSEASQKTRTLEPARLKRSLSMILMKTI